MLSCLGRDSGEDQDPRRWGVEGGTILSPPQTDSCIRMGSNESHLNVFIHCDGQSPQTTTFEVRGQPKRN